MDRWIVFIYILVGCTVVWLALFAFWASNFHYWDFNWSHAQLLYSVYTSVCFNTDQKGAEEYKGDKVEVGKITAALFPMRP